MFSSGFFVLVKRELLRFYATVKQTIMPGLISSTLLYFVFGHALGERIETFKKFHI